MLIYHHTNQPAYKGILDAGRILPGLCREMYHPEVSRVNGRATYRPALWAMTEILPDKWRNFKSDNLDLEELLWHTHKADIPAILEITIPSDADIWVADWLERLKDKKLNDDAGLFGSPRYHASMKRYGSEVDLSDMALPEVICFSEIRAEQIRLTQQDHALRPSNIHSIHALLESKNN